MFQKLALLHWQN